MSVDYSAAPNTGSGLAAQSAGAVRKLWQQGVDMFEQSSDFFMQFEGKSKMSPIQVKTDTSKGRGQTITITTMAGFYQRPKTGDQTFEAAADFEALRINSYNLVVDWLRNAVRINERTEDYMGMRGELKAGLPEELGNWLGRQKTEQLWIEFIRNLNAANYTYAGGKTSIDTLVSADTLSYNEIVKTGTVMKRNGGKAAEVGRVGVNKLKRYMVVPTTDALFSLENDSAYRTLQQNAGVRGDANWIFKGGFSDIRGHIIKEYNPIDHDGYGAVGSPANPKAYLGVAITAGSGTFDIKGGGSAEGAALTNVDYFGHFPNYAYTLLPSGTVSTDADVRYVLIYNLEGSDAGKMGMYSYVTAGINGNKITITQRLGSTNGGARVATLGSVTWNTAPWVSKHTDVHPVGSLVVPCNVKGVPFGYTLVLGAGAALRGYGKHRNKRTTDIKDGGFLQAIYITSVFGQKARKDTANRYPAVTVMCHALAYAGIEFPTVT